MWGPQKNSDPISLDVLTFVGWNGQTNRQIPAYPLILLYSNLLYSEISVDVLLGDPQCKDSNPRFTTVPFKLYYDKKCERYCRFSDSKSGFFLFVRKGETFAEKPQQWTLTVLKNKIMDI